MSAVAGADLDAELRALIEAEPSGLTVQDPEPPRCEVVWHCQEHGEEACENRARWIGTRKCSNGHPKTFLACDPCHDDWDKAEEPEHDFGPVEWRAL